MDELRKKYLGEEAAAATARKAAEGEKDDVEVKRVRSKKKAADPLDDLGPRTVIVSKTKGILGSQG